MNTRSLRFRMSMWLGALLASALLLFGATVYFGVKRHLTTQLHQSLIEQARTIGEEVLNNVEARGDHYAMVEIDESYDPEINGRFIRVTRKDGSVLYQSKNPRDGSFDANEIATVTGSDADGYVPRIVDARGSPLILQGLLYTTPTGTRFFIETGAPYRLIVTELKSILWAFALGIPVFLVVAILGGLVLVRSSLQPIGAISDQAERISSQNIGERLPVLHTGDEIERLSLSLNRMIDRLDESIRHISRFSADVSHELRTPLTILRGELEAMAGQAGHQPETLEMVGNSLEEIERLTHIVDQLLIISRLDAGQAGIERSNLDLGVLANTTAEQMRLLADEKDISINYAIEPGTTVWGDPLRLKQVLVNLLDNAIKYTPNGGHIELAVRSHGNRATLSVADNGVGISPEALPHIFERFYRADKARTRSTGGTGLGLSIVKAIVTAHDGKVNVSSSLTHGTEVQVELPLATGNAKAAPSRVDALDSSFVKAWSNTA